MYNYKHKYHRRPTYLGRNKMTRNRHLPDGGNSVEVVKSDSLACKKLGGSRHQNGCIV